MELVIEVGDSERKPRHKMRAYMRDERIPIGWRVDLPNRCVELWRPMNTDEPVDVLRGQDTFAFGGVTFIVDEIFVTVLRR